MLRIRDSIASDPIRFHYVESTRDLREVRDFVYSHAAMGCDTESTGINPYRKGWQLRSVQYGDDVDSYVVPARYKRFIGWTMRQEMNWIGHNGPHDVRSIDVHLGYETGVAFAGETYIPAHHKDSRKQQDGGTGHGLKELATAHVGRDAGKWETALKEEFKKIMVRVPGEFYKSGKRKGEPKYRKAKLSEGWSLIDPRNPAYIAYSAADPLLTYRLWRYEQYIVASQQRLEVLGDRTLYQFDHDVQLAVDELTRRGMLLDVPYTERLSHAYARKVAEMEERAREFGCDNVQSGKQLADTLIRYGAELTERTDSGGFKTDAKVLRGLLDAPYTNGKVRDFIHTVLVAKQLSKRRSSYTESMLRERDINNRVHPSINSLAARTARMSVGEPPLQQLPTKDNEDELMWDSEDEENG